MIFQYTDASRIHRFHSFLIGIGGLLLIYSRYACLIAVSAFLKREFLIAVSFSPLLQYLVDAAVSSMTIFMLVFPRDAAACDEL